MDDFDVRLARDADPADLQRAAMVRTPAPPGAIPVGADVRKVNSEPGDATADGTRGRVVAHLAAPGVDEVGYWVQWDTFPVPVFVRERKVAAA